jgi:hypothetical protein
MKLSHLCIVAAAVTPMFAHALAPGQYDVGGIQQICLLDDGTWYGTTFSNWGGAWQEKGRKTFIYGNYAAGVGNDSMDFYGNFRGAWTEWRDNLSYQIVDSVVLTFVKTDCDPPPAAIEARDSNPMDKR